MTSKPIKIGGWNLFFTWGSFWSGWNNYTYGNNSANQFQFFLFKVWYQAPYKPCGAGHCATFTLLNFWAGFALTKNNNNGTTH